MKQILILLVVVLSAACTTMRPVQQPPEQLREQVAAGEVIRPGDDVKIVTRDGRLINFV